MESNKNPFALEENAEAIQHNSLGSLMGQPSQSSPNYAEQLVNSIQAESLNNYSRAPALFKPLSNRPIFCPASSSQGGLFVQSERELGVIAWRILTKTKEVEHGNGAN